MSAGILVTVEGAPVDLSLVDWFLRAPCGCAAGVTVGFSDYGNRPPRIVVSAEQAWDAFYDTKADREKHEALGYTVFSDLRSRLKEHLTDCPHDPKWGYEKPPVPEGMLWAVGGTWGERTRVLHLAPVASVETDDYRPSMTDWRAKALCGVDKHGWANQWHITDGKVECKRCLAKATS